MAKFETAISTIGLQGLGFRVKSYGYIGPKNVVNSQKKKARPKHSQVT